MITGLEIYSLSNDKIEMYELTKNVIVLFNNSNLKKKFIEEFLKIKQDETENDTKDICYSTVSDNTKADEQDHKADINVEEINVPTSIYTVDNEQKFIFTTDAEFILQCNNPYDLWFCDTNSTEEIQVWALTNFKRYKEIWNKGIDNVYRYFIDGRFGCYEGCEK